VTQSFQQVLVRVLRLIEEADAPTDLRLLAVDVFNLDYRSQDMVLFEELSVFSILLSSAISNSNPSFSLASWTAFRIMSIQIIEKGGKLAEKILEIVFSTLEAAGKNLVMLKKGSVSSAEHQCLQLLLLLTSVAETSAFFSACSQASKLQQLIAFIQYGSFRIKLLAFRLLSQVLPAGDPKDLNINIGDGRTLLDFFFDLIGIAYANSSNQAQKKVIFRITHDIAALAAEAISLIRKLLNSDYWKDYILILIRSNVTRAASLIHKSKLRKSYAWDDEEEAILPAVAALCVIGGDIDVLHLGGRAVQRLEHSTEVTGTIIDFDLLNNRAAIVLDSAISDPAKHVSASDLTPIPEVTDFIQHTHTHTHAHSFRSLSFS
jgi:hypothetical protein